MTTTAATITTTLYSNILNIAIRKRPAITLRVLCVSACLCVPIFELLKARAVLIVSHHWAHVVRVSAIHSDAASMYVEHKHIIIYFQGAEMANKKERSPENK